jgi:hypothetical protein
MPDRTLCVLQKKALFFICFGKSAPLHSRNNPFLVPTLCVGMPDRTLRVLQPFSQFWFREILFKSLKGEFIMTQEITLTLDNKLSDVLARVIVQLDAAQYEQAKRAAFKEMEQGFHLGGVPAESLYER